MEWSWYYNGISPSLTTLLIALVIWLGRGQMAKRPGLWYTYLIIALALVIIEVQGDLISAQHFPNAPPVFRVVPYLSLALLVIVVFVVPLRKQT